MISALPQKSKFKFWTLKKSNFGFPWCSARENLSIDVLITNAGLILTKLRWFQLFLKSQNSNFELKKKIKLDVDPRRDDDASPMSSYRCMLRPTRMISALRHKSKFNFELKKKQVRTQFQIFLNQIFMIPCCSILEDLSINVSIANVGLILTKLRWFQLFVKSQNSNFELFWKKFKFWGFQAVVLVKIFPLMYQILM